MDVIVGCVVIVGGGQVHPQALVLIPPRRPTFRRRARNGRS